MSAILPLLDDIRHKVTFDELMELVRKGFFAEPSRVELLDGVIVEMAAEGSPHGNTKSLIGERLIKTVDPAFRVIVDTTLRLSEHNAPSPDIWLFPRSIDFALVGGSDVALIIEVADTSLLHDKQVKAPIYEAHGVKEYWIVDLECGTILTYRRDGTGGFVEPDPEEARSSASAQFVPDLTLDLQTLRP